MRRIRIAAASLAVAAGLTTLSASGASAFKIGGPPGPPQFTGTPNGAEVCHQTDPPKGGATVFTKNFDATGVTHGGGNQDPACLD